MNLRRILTILLLLVFWCSAVSCKNSDNPTLDTQERNTSSDATTEGKNEQSEESTSELPGMDESTGRQDETVGENKTYEVEQHIVLDDKHFSTVDKIIIVDGITGKLVEIGEQTDIESIVDMFKQIEGVNPISNKGYYGCTYAVTFYCGEDEIFHFTVLPDVDHVAFTCGLYETENGFDYPCRYTLINCSYEHIESTLKKYVE